MAYPQGPNNPYGPPEQNPYGQDPAAQNPYGQPVSGPYGQPNSPYSGTQPYGQQAPAPYGQPPNPYGAPGGQPGNPYEPYDGASGQQGAPYGQPGPYGQQSAPYGSPPTLPQSPYGQPQQYGAPLQPGYPQQQPFYGGQPPIAPKKNTGTIVGVAAVVVVIALAVGGYILFAGKTTPTPPVAGPTTTGQPAASGAPSSAPVTGAALTGQFNPPASYSSNSLSDDNGCGDYASAAAAFLTSTLGLSGNSAANSALTTLAATLKTGSTDAQDPTLAAALGAEAAFVQGHLSALTPAVADYGSSFDPTSLVSATQPIQATDNYINGVCGTASWIRTSD